MIISCTSCNKKFEIDSGLIPDGGRLLACGSCKNEWFFTKEKSKDNANTIIEKKKPSNLTFNEPRVDEKIISEETIAEEIKVDPINELEINRETIKQDPEIEEIKVDQVSKIEFNKPNIKVHTNLLNIILIFLISSAALIIVIDTFKSPIALFIPSIELILFSLFETINDLFLFFKDLIR
tara:strand:- start:250 stop:789 length:540 start_codon:yes stop_codon:yes gene_type:complete